MSNEGHALMVWVLGFLTLAGAVGTVIAMGNSKSGADYHPVTLEQVEKDPGHFHERKVEWTGTYFYMFETSRLDGKVWLEGTKSTVMVPAGANLWTGPRRKRVRVWGTLFTKEKHYGHLGMAPYLLRADKIEILPIDSQNPLITKEEALEIAAVAALNKPGPYKYQVIGVALQKDGWHVDYGVADAPPGLKGGGAPHYVIDPNSGATLSTVYDR